MQLMQLIAASARGLAVLDASRRHFGRPHGHMVPKCLLDASAPRDHEHQMVQILPGLAANNRKSNKNIIFDILFLEGN